MSSSAVCRSSLDSFFLHLVDEEEVTPYCFLGSHNRQKCQQETLSLEDRFREAFESEISFFWQGALKTAKFCKDPFNLWTDEQPLRDIEELALALGKLRGKKKSSSSDVAEELRRALSAYFLSRENREESQNLYRFKKQDQIHPFNNCLSIPKIFSFTLRQERYFTIKGNDRTYVFHIQNSKRIQQHSSYSKQPIGRDQFHRLLREKKIKELGRELLQLSLQLRDKNRGESVDDLGIDLPYYAETLLKCARSNIARDVSHTERCRLITNRFISFFLPEKDLQNVKSSLESKGLLPLLIDAEISTPPLEGIPLELCSQIFTCLSDFELGKGLCTSHSWYRLAHDILLKRWQSSSHPIGHLKKCLHNSNEALIDFFVQQQLGKIDFAMWGSEKGRFTKGQVNRCITLLPFISEIRLQEDSSIHNSTLKLLSERCRALTKLDLNGSLHLSSRGVISLAEGCKELKALHLYGRHIRDLAIEHIAKWSSLLEELSLQGCEKITDESFYHLFLADRRPRNLKILQLEGVPYLTDKAFEMIGKSENRLERLTLRRCPQITSQAIEKLKQQFSKIVVKVE